MQSCPSFSEEIMTGGEFSCDSSGKFSERVGSGLQVASNFEKYLFVDGWIEAKTQCDRDDEKQVKHALHHCQSETGEFLALKGARSGYSLALWCAREKNGFV